MSEITKELLEALKSIMALPDHKVDRRDEAKAAREAIAKAEAFLAAPQPSADEPVTDSYVQTVPDKCDRIVWRGRYIHLSVGQETTPQPSEDGWIPWEGGDCPVETKGHDLFLRFRDGSEHSDCVTRARGYDWKWERRGHPADIIAYRVVKS